MSYIDGIMIWCANREYYTDSNWQLMPEQNIGQTSIEVYAAVN